MNLKRYGKHAGAWVGPAMLGVSLTSSVVTTLSEWKKTIKTLARIIKTRDSRTETIENRV
ncbi:hypothetical protein IX53_03445 [Kosmotoga pacifica]|uniref:Uncharacterized protein n=1 Tax=Kosmotoga pacifica TaxID=1330330 RepID=A0A0G2ZDZ7_9BACT|nr:hypothetical protein IX53_03445 [Kosmotoga pacifica]